MAHTSSVLMRNYELGRLLGQGTFAKVYYARNMKTGQSVAIKVISKDKVLRAGLMDQIKREISVMRLVRHPNIVRLCEVMATKMKIYFVMEHAKGGELFNKIARGRLKEDAARKYFQQLISAVDYCHSRGVYHRDLKPENILLDEHGNLKVSDFGLSALAESKRQDGLLHTTCGTPAYVAPEVISRKGYDGAKADIWSCGVILFVLLAGFLPFHDSNLMEMYRKIGKAEFKCPNWFPHEVRQLLLKILDPNPSTRVPMDSIMENPWVRKGLGKRLVKDEKENMVAVPRDVEEAFTLSNGNAHERRQEMTIHKNLNAFDIISLSSGFDLTSLFEEPHHRREARFTSREHATKIISKIEDVAKNLRFRVTKKDNGVMRLESQKEGKKGSLEIDAEIFEVMPSFHLVEMRNVGGDSFEYQQVFNEEMQPALEGIVWAWQGDKHSNVLECQPQQQGPPPDAPSPVS